MSKNWMVFLSVVLGVGSVVGAGLALYAGKLAS